ncbi:MAG: isochorismatase family protein [Caldilineaceae bacterium]
MNRKPTIILNLRRQWLAQDAGGHNQWQAEVTQRTLPADKLALILCDVWDHHWSRGAEEREAALIPQMNRVLAALRHHGAQIIHAPSETMDFYHDHPARKRMLAISPIEPPADLPHDTPSLPVDASDHGSDTGEATTHKAWCCQHPDIVIDDARDLISDNGREIYSYLQQQQIEQVLIMGVHTNMCILNRSFAIKQMVRWGVDIALIRDLTDTMYNPAMPPYVNHDEGTRLVVEFIEKFWCPSILSADLLA